MPWLPFCHLPQDHSHYVNCLITQTYVPLVVGVLSLSLLAWQLMPITVLHYNCSPYIWHWLPYNLYWLAKGPTEACLTIYSNQLTTTYGHWPYNLCKRPDNLSQLPYSYLPNYHLPYVNCGSLITAVCLMTACLMLVAVWLTLSAQSFYCCFLYKCSPYVNHILALITLWQLTATHLAS